MVAARLILISVVVILCLAALGLWVTETPSGPETEASAVYLTAVGAALVVVTAAGLVATLVRRRRR